jgi:hypothetical protein
VSSLAACGGDSGEPAKAAASPAATPAPSATPPAAAPPDSAASNPEISGTPPTRVEATSPYQFQPTASAAPGTQLSFHAENQPSWLVLNTTTGLLAGNPRSTDVGVYSNIVVSVSDGKTIKSLPPFSVEVTPAKTSGPFFGSPVVVPGTIEAERFDRGGPGTGFFDTTDANTGGQYRLDEGVDIRVDPKAPADNFIVTNFEPGEWMAYTIDVAATGEYEWGVLASSVFNGSSYYFVVDGQKMTDEVPVPNTGSWDNFQWAGAPNVNLTKGRHVLKIVSYRAYFDIDSIVLTESPPPPPPPLNLSAVDFACTFSAIPDCGLEEQSKVPGRASIVGIGRDGGTALRLRTEVGDNDVAESGQMERDDVFLTQYMSDGYQGHEAWWAHSILFPDDFTVPTWESYVVFDFHNSGPGPWQANFHVAIERQDDITKPGLLRLVGYGGINSGDGPFGAALGQIRKNVWYDFVYHVRWSAGSDGFFDAWVNGKRVLAHRGATLYDGQGVYLKLANYHNPVCDPYPSCIGSHKPSSVIHDRIVKGKTAAAVAGGPLEDYLDLVNGVLTPRF